MVGFFLARPAARTIFNQVKRCLGSIRFEHRIDCCQVICVSIIERQTDSAIGKLLFCGELAGEYKLKTLFFEPMNLFFKLKRFNKEFVEAIPWFVIAHHVVHEDSWARPRDRFSPPSVSKTESQQQEKEDDPKCHNRLF